MLLACANVQKEFKIMRTGLQKPITWSQKFYQVKTKKWDAKNWTKPIEACWPFWKCWFYFILLCFCILIGLVFSRCLMIFLLLWNLWNQIYGLKGQDAWFSILSAQNYIALAHPNECRARLHFGKKPEKWQKKMLL